MKKKGNLIFPQFLLLPLSLLYRYQKGEGLKRGKARSQTDLGFFPRLRRLLIDPVPVGPPHSPLFSIPSLHIFVLRRNFQSSSHAFFSEEEGLGADGRRGRKKGFLFAKYKFVKEGRERVLPRAWATSEGKGGKGRRGLLLHFMAWCMQPLPPMDGPQPGGKKKKRSLSLCLSIRQRPPTLPPSPPWSRRLPQKRREGPVSRRLLFS